MISTTIRQLRHFLLTIAGLFFAASVMAQETLNIEVSGVGSSATPVMVAGFSGEDAVNVTRMIRADLARTGAFIVTGEGVSLPESTSYDGAKQLSAGAYAVAVGSVSSLSGGQVEVRYRLYDLRKSQQVSYLSLVSPAEKVRYTAHRIADDIYQKLTGIRGIAGTRLAYVAKAGKEYRLEVSDADGGGRQVALRSNEPIISPSWSPDGSKVAYVSFEAKKPVVYIQDLRTGARHVVANYKGNNSAPSWFPDGSRIAVALSKNGYTQVYTVSASGGSLKQVTHTNSICTEPQVTPDGQWIYFTSDQSGGPQIYKVSTAGGTPQRVTFSGSYNISPRVSPDGRHLAFISNRNGGFQLYLKDLGNGQEMRMSNTYRDESPSFSPNGQYIMYSTDSGRSGTLSVVSIDGSFRQKISMKATDVREPSWSPFSK
ncbi:MAG: Tol-Pal system protein TolB [Oxalobacter sp.]|nr:Tol-Pal system protein TolB [Oxalobacter sp.]